MMVSLASVAIRLSPGRELYTGSEMKLRKHAQLRWDMPSRSGNLLASGVVETGL